MSSPPALDERTETDPAPSQADLEPPRPQDHRAGVRTILFTDTPVRGRSPRHRDVPAQRAPSAGHGTVILVSSTVSLNLHRFARWWGRRTTYPLRNAADLLLLTPVWLTLRYVGQSSLLEVLLGAVLGLSFGVALSAWLSPKALFSASVHPAQDVLDEIACKVGVRPRKLIVVQDLPGLGHLSGWTARFGSVAVDESLLDRADLLRGILAHELGHATRRARLLQVVSSLLTCSGTFFVLAAGPRWWVLPFAAVFSVAGAVASTAVSRAEETLADGVAVAADPGAAASLVEVLDPSDTTCGPFASHPAEAVRVLRLTGHHR